MENKAEKLRVALQLILDSVDYTSGACLPNELVGAVLPKELINEARETIKYVEFKNQPVVFESAKSRLAEVMGISNSENWDLSVLILNACARIEKLESSFAALKEATRWRKVEEELPENGKTVWMLDRNGFIYTYNYYIGLSLSPMYTHWRPIDLPEEVTE